MGPKPLNASSKRERGEADAAHGARGKLKPAAKRALEEAEERRRRGAAPHRAEEAGGRAGPEPTRYGDWEKDGIVSDF